MSAGPYSETTLHYLHSFFSQPPQRGSPWFVLYDRQDSWCLGSCTAAGWLGKSPSPANPGGPTASAQLSNPLTPTSLPSQAPPSTPYFVSWEQQERQLAGVAREGGCVYVCVCIARSGGRTSSNDITAKMMHLNTCTHAYTVVILSIGSSHITTSLLLNCIDYCTFSCCLAKYIK